MSTNQDTYRRTGRTTEQLVKCISLVESGTDIAYVIPHINVKEYVISIIRELRPGCNMSINKTVFTFSDNDCRLLLLCSSNLAYIEEKCRGTKYQLVFDHSC